MPNRKLAEEIRRQKAANLRYKKPMLEDIGYMQIMDTLYDIASCAEEISYMEEDEILAALDDDEEQLYEFKMSFSDVAYEAEQLQGILDEICRYSDDYEQTFNDLTVSLLGKQNMKAVGYDDYEEDYFRLTMYETGLAAEESGKRIMRKTKSEMLTDIGQAMSVVIGFLNIKYKYDYLKSTIDILLDRNNGIIKTIKDIEETYNKAEEDDFREFSDSTKKLEKLCSKLPERMWIE